MEGQGSVPYRQDSEASTKSDALSSCVQTLAPLTFLNNFYINMTVNIAFRSLLALQVFFFSCELRSWKAGTQKILTVKTSRIGGRESTPCPSSPRMGKTQNSSSSHSCSMGLVDGKPRLEGYQRTPVSRTKCCVVSMKKA